MKFPFRDDVKRISSEPRDIRNFGYLVGGIAIGLGVILFFFHRGSWVGWSVFGALLLIFAALAPRILRPIYKAWMTFGVVMGFFVTTLILAAFFYLIFTPLALILRLSGKRFLELGFREREKSYWRYHSSGITRENLEQQF